MNRNDFLRLTSRAIIIATVATVMMACTRAIVAAPTITNLGALSSDPFRGSRASGVSSDGSIVVGSTDVTGGGIHAFRWTSATGMEDLGTLPDGGASEAYGVSSDGSTIIGYSSPSTGDGLRAFRWTSAGGMEDLGALPDGLFNVAIGVSSDGLTIIGESTLYGGVPNPFRWTPAVGMQPLGFGTLPGGAYAIPKGMSGDAAVIVGGALNVLFGGGVENLRGFRWTAAGGMQDLGTVPGGLFSDALAVSSDGSVVVGYINPAGLGSFAQHAFRWTSESGLQDIDTLGGDNSVAYGVSGDGSAVVGGGYLPTGYHAFLWTSSLGMVDLNTYLATLGVDLTGWELSEATAISTDGSAIVGRGYFNGDERAWLVTGLSVPEPSAFALSGIGTVALTLTAARRRVHRLRTLQHTISVRKIS
jgi:probable HAF family extracellular repeat protein